MTVIAMVQFMVQVIGSLIHGLQSSLVHIGAIVTYIYIYAHIVDAVIMVIITIANHRAMIRATIVNSIRITLLNHRCEFSS